MEFVLENEYCKVVVSERAGEIESFFDKENQREIMYQGNQGWNGKNPTLFPIIGNTYTKTYVIDGNEYAMKNHGLIRYATLIGERVNDGVFFTLKSNEETIQQYPFPFTYKIKYSLKEKRLLISYEITNDGDKVMPFQFGLHPGFCLYYPFEEYSIKFEKPEIMTQIIFDPTFEKEVYKKIIQIKQWDLSFEEVKNYAVVYENFSSSYVLLKHKEKPLLKMSIKGFPFLALWTHENRSDFICIEPWCGHTDFVKNHSDFYTREGTMLLYPNEKYEISYFIESI